MNIFDFTKEKDSDREYPYKILVQNLVYIYIQLTKKSSYHASYKVMDKRFRNA